MFLKSLAKKVLKRKVKSAVKQKAEEIPKYEPVKKIKHDFKIKRAYVYFYPSNCLGLLVKPYFEELPNEKVKIFWKEINSEGIPIFKPVRKTVLPRTCVFWKDTYLKIASYQVLPIWNYDIYGNRVNVNPLQEWISVLEDAIVKLKKALKVEKAEREALIQTTDEKISSLASKLEEIRRAVQYPAGSFYYEEQRTKTEGEEEEYGG